MIALTIVDTPGLTRIRLENQPEDIVERLDSIARHYIENENVIILAITSSVNDLATSEALRLAKVMDPSLKRTLGVLTKIDLMSPDTNCLTTMENRLFRLALGFVGTKCNYKKPDDQLIDFEELYKQERRYFDNHDIYRKKQELFGIKVLQEKLSHIFNNSIRDVIPELTSVFRERKLEVKTRLKELNVVEIRPAEMILKAVKTLEDGIIEIQEKIHGNSTRYSHEELIGGSKFRKVFVEFHEKMEKQRDIDVKSAQIIKLRSNINGLDEHNILKSNLIKSVLPKYFSEIEKTIKECVDEISSVFEDLLQSVNLEMMIKFPNIKRFFLEEFNAVMKKNKRILIEKLTFLVSLEKNYIDPDDKKIRDIGSKPIQADEDVYVLLQSYYELSRESLDKNVPKNIKCFYIDGNIEEARRNMITKATNCDLVATLFRQDKNILDEQFRLTNEKDDIKEILGKLILLKQQV